MSATKKTLAQLNKELTDYAQNKRSETMQLLGFSSVATLYDRINRPWTCSPVERKAICEMLNTTEENVDWQKPTKQKILIA
jgi:hypothetical protein